MPADRLPRPGAVIVLSAPSGDPEQARRRAMSAFASDGVAAELFAEGPLTVAWRPGPERSVHVDDRTVCLLEGALYEQPADVSALARAYQEAGEEILARLRGEFWAFVWDRRRLAGLVWSDHIGSRAPYYFGGQGGALVVASEISELLDTLPTRPGPDPLALAHWVMSTGPQAGTTLFAGVSSVRAGHCLRVEPGSVHARRYWSPSFRPALRGSPAEQAGPLRAALEVAVSRRHRPTGSGVLLSGGLDSSTVAGLAARQGRIGAYSAVFPDYPNLDEAALIDQTVAMLGIESTRIVVRGGSTLDGALAYLEAWKVPPTSPNLFFWMPLLERASADGVEVMLDGEGGDELFAFSPYLLGDLLARGRFGRAFELAHRWPGEPDPPGRRLVLYRLRMAGLAALVPGAAHQLLHRLPGRLRPAPGWLPARLARDWAQSDQSAYGWKQLAGPRWWAYIVDMVTRGAGPSAVYEHARRRAGLVGASARHPLVDVDVIEAALGVDPELTFDPRYNRAVLREAITGLVPEAIRVRRGKSNFDALFHALLAGPELPAARELLDPVRAELRAYLDMAALHRELFGQHPRAIAGGLGRWAILVWRLLTAECWLRAQQDGGRAPVARGLGLAAGKPEFEVRRPG